jgi:hypothetical protein
MSSFLIEVKNLAGAKAQVESGYPGAYNISPIQLPSTLKAGDRVNDLCCAHNGVGVVWQIDIERSVHHFIGVIRRCVSCHGDIVAELDS